MIMSTQRRLARHSDERGHLVAVTSEADVPFAVRRIFWIYGNADGLARAGHANAATTEMLVCVAGACRARLEDATGTRDHLLDRPDRALIVPPATWLDLTDFTVDCVLLVLADTEFSADDAVTERAALGLSG